MHRVKLVVLMVFVLGVGVRAQTEQERKAALESGKLKPFLEALEWVRAEKRADLLPLVVARLEARKQLLKDFGWGEPRSMALGGILHTLVVMKHKGAASAILPHFRHPAIRIKSLAYALNDPEGARDLLHPYLEDSCGRNCQVAWTAALDHAPGAALQHWFQKVAFRLWVEDGEAGLGIGGGAGGAIGLSADPNYGDHPYGYEYRVSIRQGESWKRGMKGEVVAEGDAPLGWPYRIVAARSYSADAIDILSINLTVKPSDVREEVLSRIVGEDVKGIVLGMEYERYGWGDAEGYLQVLKKLVDRERAARKPIVEAAKKRGWVTEAEAQEMMVITYVVGDAREDRSEELPELPGNKAKRQQSK